MSSRRQGREAALQIIYLSDLCGIIPEEVPDDVLSDEPLGQKTRDFAVHLASGTVAKAEELESLIAKYAQNWDLARMAAAARRILRLVPFRLLTYFDTPLKSTL